MSLSPEQGLPSSNRGVSENEQLPALIDWIAFSIDLPQALYACMYDYDPGTLSSTLDAQPSMAYDIAQLLNLYYFNDAFKLDEEIRKGTFYKYRFLLLDASEDIVGMIEMGGDHTIRKDGAITARLQLMGTGCASFENRNGAGDHSKRWCQLATLLGMTGGQITRVDLACDDHNGLYPIQWAIQQYHDGEFDNRGQKPKARIIDDFNSGQGKTLYIGSRQSQKLLRVYEKGKQLGDDRSQWVRYEVEFKSSSRHKLPLDMLTRPAEYLAGAYAVFCFVSQTTDHVHCDTEKTKANAVRAIKHIRHQYGLFFNLMLTASDGDEQALADYLINLSRPGLPVWTKSNKSGLKEISQLLSLKR